MCHKECQGFCVSRSTRAAVRDGLLGLTAACAILGCGGNGEGLPRAAVLGTVLVDDQPMPVGVIHFVPEGKTEGPKLSLTIRNGVFSASADRGPIVGEHRIEIETRDDLGFDFDDESAIAKLESGEITPNKAAELPVIYNDQSQLTASVASEGLNEMMFELKTTP